MDQFAVSMGKENNVILLNSSNLDYSYVPYNLNKKIVVINTNKERTLDGSKYNERVKECNIALKFFKQYYDIENLCQLNLADISKYESMLDPIIYKRAHHVVSEQQRTLNMSIALSNNDFSLVSQLMKESHLSLSKDYEVSCFELDTLCNIAYNLGINAFRMTGAGFGGCVIGIVDDDKLDLLLNEVKNQYYKLTGLKESIFIVSVSDGPKLI